MVGATGEGEGEGEEPGGQGQEELREVPESSEDDSGCDNEGEEERASARRYTLRVPRSAR
eukprot:509875-Hanusia_phi.AAC.1